MPAGLTSVDAVGLVAGLAVDVAGHDLAVDVAARVVGLADAALVPVDAAAAVRK
jgi:hypothetical protein